MFALVSWRRRLHGCDRSRCGAGRGTGSITVRATEDAVANSCVVDAAYVIGADGAASFVRAAIGVPRTDLGFRAMDHLVVDFEHNDPDRDMPQLPEVYQVLDIKRPSLAGRWNGGRWSRGSSRQ